MKICKNLALHHLLRVKESEENKKGLKERKEAKADNIKKSKKDREFYKFIKFRGWLDSLDSMRKNVELRDFEQNIALIQNIEDAEYFKKIEKVFPKG